MRLIDADALEFEENPIEPIMNRVLFLGGRSGKTLGAVKLALRAMIDTAPTIDPEELRPKGRWIHCNGKSNLWHCSECGEKILYNPIRRTYNIEKRPVHKVNKYCRGCGAIMNGGNADGICKED